MTTKEDRHNVYIENYTILKGKEKVDIKAREIVIWSMLSQWLSKNPLKRKKNINLDDYLYIRFDGMQETVNKAIG